jgi:4-nitrophenyl phosphatase
MDCKNAGRKTGELNKIRLFLLDMDGTLYLEEKVLPEVFNFFDALEEKNINFLYLTNNSSRDRLEYEAKIKRLGLPFYDGCLLTSADVTVNYLLSQGRDRKVFLVGTAALKRQFQEAGIILSDSKNCDVAVVGFDTELTYDKLKGLYLSVLEGKEYIATHPDMLCPMEGGFIPDIGAIIAYIESITGRLPDKIMGKPERYMMDEATSRFNVLAEDVAVVGDRLYTDIELANRANATSILVLTGETSMRDADEGDIKPDYIFESLSGIIERL